MQPGTRIAEIVDVSRIELTLLVSDRQIEAMRPGATVQVRVDPLGNQPFEGRIARVGGAPRDEDQRYPVVVELDNAARRLRTRMAGALPTSNCARASMPGRRRRAALSSSTMSG